MAAAEEAVMRGKRRRMRRLEHEMPAIAIDRFDERRLLLRVAAPQQERDRGLACVDQPDDGVGEAFPAAALVRSGVARLDGQHRIEQQHPRSEEHTSELQSIMRISYAVFCLKKTNTTKHTKDTSSKQQSQTQQTSAEHHA